MAKEARDANVSPLRGLVLAFGAALSLVPAPVHAAHREAQWAELAAAVGSWQPPTADVRRADLTISEGELILTLQSGPTEKVRVLLSEFPASRAEQRGERLRSLMWLTDPHDPMPSWRPALQDLRRFVASLDHGQFASAPSSQRAPPRPPPPVLIPLTWVLLLLSVIALAAALRLALRNLQAPRFWLPLVLLAWLVRALMPHRMVMVYFGFLHTQQAITLDQLPRYGPATTLLDHAVFAFLPPHHATVQQLHALLGALTILPLAALTQRLAGQTAARALAVTLLVLPVALLDHGSESMLVPAMLWWSAGTLLLLDALQHRRLTLLPGAVVLLALCGLARPDCMLMAAPTALCLVAAQEKSLSRWLVGALLAALAALALLWLPGALFLRDRALDDLAAGNLPRLNWGFFRQLPAQLWQGWLVLDWRYWPAPLTLLALVGLLSPQTRRPVALLWLASTLWAVPMLLDFNETSELRLHMPSGLLVLMAAALTVGAVWQRRGARWVWPLGVVTAMALVQTAPQTLAPQLSDQSERVIAAASALARDGKKTALIVRSYDDEDSVSVHLFWPQYTLEPGDRWLSVRDWQAGKLRPGERALGVIDVRCHARVPLAANTDARVPEHTAPHPTCAALWQAAKGPPLWQETIENRGERGFDWYPPKVDLPSLPQAVLAL